MREKSLCGKEPVATLRLLRKEVKGDHYIEKTEELSIK
jgi:hypothetical protein